MIDIVLPYVDCEDPVWQDIFLQAKHLPVKTPRLREVSLRPFRRRFASYGLFKYWWRALCANFEGEWRVHLLLMMPSQRPQWLKDDPRAVLHYHGSFLPQGLRPCFNSSAIELYAVRSLGLGPRFLLANDDMYFNQPCSADDFFDGDAPLTHIAVKGQYGHGTFQCTLENGRCLVSRHYGKPCPAYAYHHLIQAYSTAYCKEFLESEWGRIAPRLGRFRTAQDYNHLLLMMGQDLSGVSRDSDRYPATGYYEMPRLKDVPREALLKHKVICLNDTDSQGVAQARAYLESRYPAKCPLEK